MKITKLLPLIMIMLIALPLTGALAQTEQAAELKLRMNKSFGYQSGNDVQGNINLNASGLENLTSVEFFIDGKSIGTVSTPPFKITFVTDDYSEGEHPIHAVGTTSSGTTLTSNTIRATFVSAEDSWKAALKIGGPILALALIVTLFSAVGPLLGRKKLSKLPLGAERKYGFNGGAVCKNCHRPFPLSPIGLNLIVGKLQACPFCGKWGLQHPVSQEKLRAAENAELALARPEEEIRSISEEEKLKKELDESRYTNG
jgi:hypothetical protein